jgi:ankyrin repeat protein
VHLDRVGGANIDTRDNVGKTLLHYACERGNLGIVARLLESADSVCAFTPPDFHGRTLLHYATESSRAVQTIDLLRDLDIDVHAKDSRGRTALHHAAAAGNVGAVEKLLEIGAEEDLYESDNDGRNVVQLAAWYNRRRVVDVLSAYCGDVVWEGLEEEGDTNENRLIGCEGKRDRTRWAWCIVFFVLCFVLLGRGRWQWC